MSAPPVFGVDGPERRTPSPLEEARDSRAASVAHFLSQLARETDPAARRQIVTELALVPPAAAERVLSTLLPYLARETDARCRAETLSALATLADGLEAEKLSPGSIDEVWTTIHRQMELDDSWDVRLFAARILAVRGNAAASSIALEALPRKDELWRDTLLALPALLARVATPEAEAELRALWIGSLPSDRRLALEAAAALYRVGRLDDRSWESVLGEFGNLSADPAVVLRAGSLLAEFGARDAAVWPRVSRQLSEWGWMHRNDYAGPFLVKMSGEMAGQTHAGLLAYNPALAYEYASDWWDGTNHSCGSAYDACTPWSYWGSEHCGYSSHGGDCANFVSQSLLAGGHGALNGGLPCRGYPCGTEEIGAKNLGDCLVQKGWIRTCGYQQSPPPNVAVGDVLIYHASSCTGSTAHSTFVMYVNGSDVRIACHSSMQWNKPYTYLSGTHPYYEWLHNPNSLVHPPNDDCNDASQLVSNTTCSYTPGTFLGATASGLPKPPCDGFGGPNMYDVWYRFTAVASSQTVTVDPETSVGDPVVSVYSSCGGSSLGCSDNGGEGGAETLLLTGLTVGSTYYVRVYDYGSAEPVGDNAAFGICVTSPLTSYTLTVTGSGTGQGTVTGSGINCTITSGSTSGTCSASYSSGTSVSLSATPTGGSTFSSWGGDCAGTGGCSFTMSRNRVVSASFAAPATSYTLSVTGGGTGQGTVTGSGINCTITSGSTSGTCSASYSSGTSVSLSATPTGGSTFSSWGGDCAGTGGCSFTMSRNRVVSASFAAPATSYTLSVTGGGTGQGTVTGSGINCTITSGSTSGTCSASYSSGTSVSLSATPTGGSTFSSWGGDCAGTGGCSFTMNRNRLVSASFIGGGGSFPNLTPYQRSGWGDKIVVATTAGATADSTVLSPSDPLYVSWFAINNGSASISSSPDYWFYLYLDGILWGGWYAGFPLDPGEVIGVPDSVFGSLSQGTHTLRLVCDASGVVAESDEGDNEYTKTIMVGAATPTRFYTATPCRLFDTRNASGADAGSPILGGGETRALPVGGRCSVPSGAKSLSVNVTVTGQAAAGDFLLFRGDLATAPTASSLSFRPGKTRANNSILELSRDGSGTFKVWNNSAGPAHFILDVNGYFQ